MDRFFGDFQLDRLSFWLGFVAASLMWWLAGRLKPLLALGWQGLKNRAGTVRQGLTAGAESRLRSDTLQRAQRMHLAAPLFSLDEIIILPRLLATPPPFEPGISLPEEITNVALPELPDWPELAAAYGAPTFTLAEALAGGANLVLTGRPGSGKTVALAHLTSQIARQDPEAGELAGWLPVLIHVSNLPHTARRPEDDPLAVLIDAAVQSAPTLAQPRLPQILQAAFQAGRAILLLDGLDELPPAGFNEITGFLGRLLERVPALRAVATSPAEAIGELARLGFTPVPIAAWTDRQRETFIRQWSQRWNQISPPVANESARVDSLLVDEWLLNDPGAYTPLEVTLKTWAAHAGDSLGPAPVQAIEAHLRRITAGIPKARPALEKIAAQMVLSEQADAGRKELEGWLNDNDPSPAIPGSEPAGQLTGQEPLTGPRILPALIENGLLQSRRGDRVGLAHPVLAGFLAACHLGAVKDNLQLAALAGSDGLLAWTGRALALEYLLAGSDAAQLVSQLLEGDGPPLYPKLMACARWIRTAPENLSWRTSVLRRLAVVFQKEGSPAGLRARAMTALATSGTASTAVLFQQAMGVRDAVLRQLGALGAGLLREPKAIPGLIRLLSDPAPNTRRAACLALVRIGTKESLEAVAETLLHGDEDLRRAAAEALANHPEEGHPTLQEGSRIDDLLVRRAAIFGLQRVREPWAAETLQKMQIEEAQWVVKNVAAQALEELERPNPRLPRRLPPLTHTPWLIAFACERGIGVAPGNAAVDLLLQALREGNEDQRLAALDQVGRLAEPRAIPTLFEMQAATHGELREATFTALWWLAAAGAYP